MVSAPGRREQVRYMASKGLSERHALRVAGMSASALRYTPRPDRNVELREQILSLAHRHKRYDVGMIYLKLRQMGHVELQACRALISASETAAASPQAQESACRRASTAVAASGRQRGVVDGFHF